MNEKDTSRARHLLAAITDATSELEALLDEPATGDGKDRFDELDRGRRRRPEWRRRGRVFHAIAQAGGRVTMLEFSETLLAAGYKDARGANGFFRGDPMPVLERVGDDVVLTERGEHAARFYERFWLPQEAGGDTP